MKSLLSALKDFFAPPVPSGYPPLTSRVPNSKQQRHALYQQQIATLKSDYAALQQQLSATQANRDMMAAMLQNSQQYAAQLQAQAQIQGGAGGGGRVYVKPSDMMWDVGVHDALSSVEKERKEKEEKEKTLKKLLEATL